MGTTHISSQTENFTSIDFSLCFAISLLDITWRVLPDLYGSDHFPNLKETGDSEQRSRPLRWRLDKTDWQWFTELSSLVCPLSGFGSCLLC